MIPTRTSSTSPARWPRTCRNAGRLNELCRDTSQLRQNDMFGFSWTPSTTGNGHNLREPAQRLRRPDHHRRGQSERRLEPGGKCAPVDSRAADRRDGGAVQVAALQLGHRSDLGHSAATPIRRKNEWTHLTAVPASTGGSTSIFRVSRAATLIGPTCRQPAEHRAETYGISKRRAMCRRASRTTSIRTLASTPRSVSPPTLTADITVNTDFAQVEVDEQQVNLTRFNPSLRGATSSKAAASSTSDVAADQQPGGCLELEQRL